MALLIARAARWLLVPWWAAQVFTAEKAFHANPILGSERLNRAGLHTWRARLAQRLTARRRRSLERLVSADDRAAFERDGYISKQGFLPPDAFVALQGEIAAYRGPAREFKEGQAITRRFPLTPGALERMPSLRRLLDDPRFRGLTRYAASFDAEPTLYLQTIFSHVDKGKPDPQTRPHMDTFHPTMKAWLFLQDMTEATGTLMYARGSHRRTEAREAWEQARSVEASRRKLGGAFRIEAGDLAEMGAEALSGFVVPANTFVVADTSGFHARGEAAGPGARVEIWALSRRNPFTPWTGFDLPAAIRRRLPLASWALMSLKRSLGLPTPAFRELSDVGVSEPPAPWL